MELEFRIGDHVMLTCQGNQNDPDYGLTGIVIDYDVTWGGKYPVVQIDENCSLYDRDEREVDWFKESAWTLIRHPNECVCNSLL